MRSSQYFKMSLTKGSRWVKNRPMLDIPKIVPVFPLPTVVFFPKTYLPLHIFEPRYCEMVRESLKGDQVIMIALLKEGWENNYYGNPEIYPVGCVGKIVKSQDLEDGRYNILLYGLVRVRIKEPIYEKNYRQAWVEQLLPMEHGVQSLGANLRHGLLEQLKGYGKLIGAQPQMEHFLKIEMDDETLVNLFSAELNFTMTEKQFLLEAEILPQQCKRLIDLIQFKIHEVANGQASS
ncbi:MAG: LON peptidase substrate-binding domain-containing protein [Nitrospira sp.]|nr:LON peptidase substrate-binding domain-containing protein [Nitrospira sp.]